ncbi:GNAT family N-acetyltransferase [Flavobacterium urocaniciphilum]|uniref:Protein N-acetyltransferase, RimJ/RimL family n=1 Tax=Flavobacterium urocaniciphilum TaxID=1299341 RepID=A0A1H8YXQ7_9FLAO|nr:GNAT family N-acetyltransferase [Flavobacterium urocaniciphilum]SEP56892.1 Protein N-acetyltransferase, RimJ/RimL family [Flavobacterium urocaniciphilum]
MRKYKCLTNNTFEANGFHIEPLRDEDKYAILEIRNQQIYHLRQAEPLTKEKQENYFSTVVASLFDQEKPSQLLFSFFENNEFIGYGGLVHINWIDKNAEISFVMKTELEAAHFSKYWSNYLNLIEELAFSELNFHKIFTYAFDLRPHLYNVLLLNGFKEEARLKEHCYFDGTFLDVVYHAKWNRKISFRKATEKDMMLYFDWTNDASVRENSYQSGAISLENHQNWFQNKIKDATCSMLVFENHLGNAIGQVRIQNTENNTAIIGISNDKNHRGKGYASEMIRLAAESFLMLHPEVTISAYIKLENTASEKAFKKAGFELESVLNYENIPSFHYIKKL